MKKTFLGIVGFVALLCMGCSDDSSSSSHPVDYSSAESWLALPGMASTAVTTPFGSGLSSLEATAPVDVFYIHPTNCTKPNVLNCELEDSNTISMLVTMEQATVYNAMGKIYAPKYRQMALPLYDLGDSPDFQHALTFAYEDVKSAFRYYLQNYNKGRPFIIAAHSQGTDHARRLIMEEVYNTPRQPQFVAAWTPGQPTPYTWFDNDLGGPRKIPPCTSAAQTGCIAVWQSFGEGVPADVIAQWNASDVYWNGQQQRWVFPVNGEVLYNVNPLTWTTDPGAVDPALNLGTLPLGVAATDFTGLYAGVVNARNLNGYLSVSPQPLPSILFAPIAGRNPYIYHSYDYALFWLNIRNNVKLRVQAYLQQQNVQYPLITSTNRVSGTVGSPFTYQIATINTATAYTATILPDGLQLSTSGVISGTPTTPGVYKVVLKASNSAGDSSAELAVTINP